MNRLERKALTQIKLNEGIVSTLAHFFLSDTFRKSQKALAKMKKDDPELVAQMASLSQNFKILQKTLKRLNRL